MKRVALIALVCITLGVLINVAVVVLLSVRSHILEQPNRFDMWRSIGNSGVQVTNHDLQIWRVHFDDWADEPFVASSFTSTGRSHAFMFALRIDESQFPDPYMFRHALIELDEQSVWNHTFGFPFRCASYSEWNVVGVTNSTSGTTALQLGDLDLPSRFLPWPFLANVAIYATPFALVFIIRSRPIRAARVRRGHCPACNYDLRHDLDAGCSECGWGRSGESGGAAG